jgi:hypothetical protein
LAPTKAAPQLVQQSRPRAKPSVISEHEPKSSPSSNFFDQLTAEIDNVFRVIVVVGVLIGGYFYFRKYVHFELEVSALDPNQTPNWETLDYTGPIPARESHGLTTTTAYDPNLSFRIGSWICEGCGSGEQSQISRNDQILKIIMRLATMDVSKVSRNDSVETTYPDFVALFNNVPLFIAEERPGDDLQGAIQDCMFKFYWIPSLENLPFYVCFAFCFSRAALVIMRRGMHPVSFPFPIITPNQRIRFLQKAITYARVLRYFVEKDMILPNDLAFNTWHQRENGKWIRLNFNGFEVKCDSEPKFKELKTFYRACRNVPHLEHVVETSAQSRHFRLVPIGASARLRHLHQLCYALRCVVGAIWEIHALGWLHTDIRWRNVVKITDVDWCVIDCYNACKASSQDAKNNNLNLGTDRNQVAQLISRFDANTRALLENVSVMIINGSPVDQIAAALDSVRLANADMHIPFY